MKSLASASADGKTIFDGANSYRLVFCKDCSHSVALGGRIGEAVCYALGEPKAMATFDLVTGEKASIFAAEEASTCVTMRAQGGKCGPEGKLYQETVKVG